ncbi:MSHA biogenesis protein MshL [Gammaproteobacteria bacterium]
MTKRGCLWWLRGYALLLIGMLIACTPLDDRRNALTDQIQHELAMAAVKGPDASHAAVENALPPPPLHVPLPASRPESVQRFNLTVNNAPASELFVGLAAGTPYSILLHPEVAGTLSVSLKNVTLFETLDALRDLYGYDYRVTGNRIFVLPLTLQTRVFRVNYLIGNRKGLSDLRVISGSVSDVAPVANTGQQVGSSTTTTNTGSNTTRGQENSHITTTSNSDFWTDLSRSLIDLVGHEPGRNVITNPQSGIVVVRAMPSELRDVADFLRAMELSVERQVILEAKIINVSLKDDYQAGINWAGVANSDNSSLVAGRSSSSFTANSTGATIKTENSTLDSSGVTIGGGLFGIAFVHKGFSALLEFLQTQGNIQVLSSPRIATLNNQKAVLKVGTDEFFVTGVSSTTVSGGTTSATTPNVTLQPFFSGITLDVTPQIDQENNIILHIHPSVSDVSQASQRIDLGNNGVLNLPLAKSNVSETDSIIRTHDGQIVALGGLMTQTVSDDRTQLPGLGDLPVVGGLFRNTNQSLVKKELVILLKASVVQDGAAWNQAARSYQQAFERETIVPTSTPAVLP